MLVFARIRTGGTGAAQISLGAAAVRGRGWLCHVPADIWWVMGSRDCMTRTAEGKNQNEGLAPEFTGSRQHPGKFPETADYHLGEGCEW